MNQIKYAKVGAKYQITEHYLSTVTSALSILSLLFEDDFVTPHDIIKSLTESECSQIHGMTFNIAVYSDTVMINMAIMFLNGLREVDNYKLEFSKTDFLSLLNAWISLSNKSELITLSQTDTHITIEGNGVKFSAPWKRFQYDWEGTEEDEVLNF